MTVTLAITNAGVILSGDWQRPIHEHADTVLVKEGVIEAVGHSTVLGADIAHASRVLDANGATVAPGLIDSHCHVVLGDYTPRQKTVDFLASYVHGGITRVVSPGEIHAPGRPNSAIGVKALAVAAKTSFDNFRPGGMTVHAGAVVLEPTLERKDFEDLQRAGVRLAKYGFGNFADPCAGVPQVRMAQEHGITVMSHSGGASIPGSQPITPDHLLQLAPDVCGHLNGGPTSLEDSGVDRIIDETSMALQLVQAGNLKSAVRIITRAERSGEFKRIVIGSDTPTGTGVMPLGVLKTIAELSSLSGIEPAKVWAAATGNNASVWGLTAGLVRAGSDADLVIIDAPKGSTQPDALSSLARGDLPGISAVVTAGVVRVLRSRNTPQATRQVICRPEIEGMGEHA